MRPTVDALSRCFDVRTFSLDSKARSLDEYAAKVQAVMDRGRIERAVVCGVSFGGLVALRFAAEHPDRTRALVLVSTPAPGFTLRPRHRTYARLPWIFGPVFLIESPWRLRHEIRQALPDKRDRRRFRLSTLRTLCTAGLSLTAMANRALLMGADDPLADCRRITAPTLVVTGEAGLDYVVPADASAAYATLIAGARGVVLERTGHIGCMTRPAAFSSIVDDFVRRLRLQPDRVA